MKFINVQCAPPPAAGVTSRWQLNSFHTRRRSCVSEFTAVVMWFFRSSKVVGGDGTQTAGSIWKFRTSSFKCYVDHSHTMYSSGNIDIRKWVHLFESRCIYIYIFAHVFPFGDINLFHSHSTSSTVCSIFMCPASLHFMVYNLFVYMVLLTADTNSCGLW